MDKKTKKTKKKKGFCTGSGQVNRWWCTYCITEGSGTEGNDCEDDSSAGTCASDEMLDPMAASLALEDDAAVAGLLWFPFFFFGGMPTEGRKLLLI